MYYAWAIVGNILAVIVCLYALWRGGSVERYGAAIIGIGWIMTYLVQAHGGHGPGIGVFIVDVVCMVLLIGLSVWSRALWTIFAAAFQVDAVLSHFASFVSAKISIAAYVTAIGLWGGYGLLAALAGGMWALELKRAKLRREAQA